MKIPLLLIILTINFPGLSGQNNGMTGNSIKTSGSNFSPSVQTISLASGWNIVSFNLLPDSADMKVVFRLLISDGSLIKVQDETGNSLEDYGILGGWVNNIGNISPSEGYKVKVIRECRLDIEGLPVLLPFETALKQGWNIMGYPRTIEKDGLSVIQQLIGKGKLVKVQDEKGNAIEDYGILGGWTNNIGNFKPGEGYKVKVAAKDTLIITGNPPQLYNLPDIVTAEDTQTTLPLDDYASDAQTPDSGLQWSCTGNNKITININPVTHVATFSAPADWNGHEDIAFMVKDGDNETACDTISVTFTPVDDAPRKTGNITNQANPEDEVLTFSVEGIFYEPDGEALNYFIAGAASSVKPDESDLSDGDALTYVIANLQGTWTEVWNGPVVSITAPENYYGTVSKRCVVAEDPHGNYVLSNFFSITKTPVNDPVIFNGKIEDQSVIHTQSITIDLKNYFQDIEQTSLHLYYSLSGLSLGTWSVSQGILKITGTTTGGETDLRVSAFDGEATAYSNYFSLTVKEIEKSMVTFKFRDAAQDTNLVTGTSTLRYKKAGNTGYTTLTSPNGTFTVEMDRNFNYEIDGSHSGDIETKYNAPGIWVAFKRRGDLEAFEQRAIDDTSSVAIFTGVKDTIFLYKLLGNFPLDHMTMYASEGSGVNIGTRKFATWDKDAPLVWDMRYRPYTAEQMGWLKELRDTLISLPHVYVTLPIIEATAPVYPSVGIAIDPSFPGPGTNATSYNKDTNAIIHGSAAYPLYPPKSTFNIEILQAFGDLNDVGAVNPDIQDANRVLNSTGRQIFSVMYLFKPKTKF